MTDRPPSDIPEDFRLELDAMLRMGSAHALATTDFAAALDLFCRDMPAVAPGYVGQIPPGAERALGYAMFREIWNYLPRPDHDWKPLKVPKPERNAPCPCGSGQKYKQCCGPFSGATPFGEGGFSLLPYVLETIPVAQYKNLPFRKLVPEEVAHVGEQWREFGRHDAAAALLEALLAPGAKLDGRHEHAFDVLCDLYLDIGDGDRRVTLAERLMQLPDRELAAAAMHRRCTMCADAGDYDAAWRLFGEAQRRDPDNPSLAHLELVLLASRGDIQHAGERARFWAARLRKLGYEGEEIVAWMDDIARDPRSLLDMMAAHGGAPGTDDEDDDSDDVTAADAAALVALVDALPAAAAHYRLQPQDGDAGPLEATPLLAKVEREWRRVFDDEPGNCWRDTAWIGWLRDNPLAWQSFTVIDDLNAELAEAVFPEQFDDDADRIEEALLHRGVALLRANIAAAGAEGCTLPWGFIDNRPALRLVMRLAELTRGTDEDIPLLEWLVLTLNPNDNGGQREWLVHRLCEAGRAIDALTVCDRYPDDGLNAMRYGQVLALQLAGRRGDAVAALAAAKKAAPRILKTLLAARPKAPALRPGLITHGGEDEAWLYRTDWRHVWEATGALVWLKSVAG